ncbi:MAG: hypothetical protein FJW35_00135 [Acidobacteria bacterium]|nr:hypothetical protein [Acidobacteriota bacterium]
MKALVATVCTPDDRSALAAVRALAAEGAQAYAGGTRPLGQAFHSRHAAGRVRYPHPAQGDEAFIGRLADECRRLGIDVVLPTSDYVIESMSRRRDLLADVVSFTLPPADGLAVARDKQRTVELARSLGLDTPVTACPADADELRRAAAQFRFPVVVKPRKSLGAVGFQLVLSKDELLDGYGRSRGISDDVFDFNRPLIQEYIPGEVHDACVLAREGELAAGLTQRRIRMYPPGGGAGVLNETTWEPDLLERAGALLRALRWHGPAQVEFKLDPQSGRACLLEINGRFWGTLDLSVQAGMNFPWLAARLALGLPVRAPERYRVGLQYRWPLPFGLLLALQRESRPGAIRSFFLPRRGMLSDFRISDPAPHIHEAIFSLYRICRRRSLRPVRDLGSRAIVETARETGGRWSGTSVSSGRRGETPASPRESGSPPGGTR